MGKWKMDKTKTIGQREIKTQEIRKQIGSCLLALELQGFNSDQRNSLIVKMFNGECSKCGAEFDGRALLFADVEIPSLKQKLSKGRCECGSKKIILYVDFAPKLELELKRLGLDPKVIQIIRDILEF